MRDLKAGEVYVLKCPNCGWEMNVPQHKKAEAVRGDYHCCGKPLKITDIQHLGDVVGRGPRLWGAHTDRPEHSHSTKK